MSTSVDSSFEPLIRQFFKEQCSSDRVTAAEDMILDEDLWGQVLGMGLPLIDIPEGSGGADGTLAELVVVTKVAGAAAAPIPLVETHVALWALARAGVDLPAGPLSLIPGDDRDELALTTTAADGTARLTGRAHEVPWARAAEAIVVITTLEGGESLLVQIPTTAVSVEGGTDLAGQPKDTVVMTNAPVLTKAWTGRSTDLRERAMLLRAALMAGALAEVATLTRSYANERQQFGRPIGAFQSVQQHLVHLEQMATLADVAVDKAAYALSLGTGSIEVTLAKLLLNDSAMTAVRAAHQAHGAIGMTQEYRLQHLTRRLNSWMGEFGSHADLAPDLGRAASGTGLARLITAPAGTVEVPDV